MSKLLFIRTREKRFQNIAEEIQYRPARQTTDRLGRHVIVHGIPRSDALYSYLSRRFNRWSQLFIRRCAHTTRDKLLDVPVFSQRSRITRTNEFAGRRRSSRICLSDFPANSERNIIASSLVNVGSGQSAGIGLMLITLDGIFIRLWTVASPCGRSQGGRTPKHSFVIERLNVVMVQPILGSRSPPKGSRDLVNMRKTTVKQQT